MAARLGTSLTANGGQTRKTMTRRGGLPSMSKTQAEAYLIARDVVRRIQRTSPLVLTPPSNCFSQPQNTLQK